MTDHVENAGSGDAFHAGLITRPTLEEVCRYAGVFHMQHWRGPEGEGELLHEEYFNNKWVDAGKSYVLLNILSTSGVAPTALFIGLKQAGTVADADTMATHSGWSEGTVIAARGTVAWSAPSGTGTVSRASSANTSFSITGTQTIAGAFIVLGAGAVSTVGNGSGTLFSAGDFGASRSVNSGDTLTVGYTASLT
jgi:hypothetical protein